MDSQAQEVQLPDEITAQLVDGDTYAVGKLHEIYRWLRKNNPLGVARAEGFDPFWVAVKHEDINYISRNNALFHSAERSTTLMDRRTIAQAMAVNGIPHFVRSLVQMDAPDHMKHRRLTQAWFMPRNLASIEGEVRALAVKSVEHMAGLGGRCDFVKDVALNYPLAVIMSILGIPDEDFPRMLLLTQELFGPGDAESRRAMEVREDLDIAKFIEGVMADYAAYFDKITEDRRRNPRDDLSTLIATAQIDGKPMGDFERLGYYTIVATAGHDTTSSSTAAAMWALAAQEGLLDEIKADPALIGNLIEESIRWETPVKTFMRSASGDTELRGRKIAKGDWLMLCYASANRDEEVFPRPDVFDIHRPETKNQLAFGNGAHVCIGQHLARLEMRILFETLLPRLKSVRLSGAPQHVRSAFVNGLKTLPIEYEMTPEGENGAAA